MMLRKLLYKTHWTSINVQQGLISPMLLGERQAAMVGEQSPLLQGRGVSNGGLAETGRSSSLKSLAMAGYISLLLHRVYKIKDKILEGNYCVHSSSYVVSVTHG